LAKTYPNYCVKIKVRMGTYGKRSPVEASPNCYVEFKKYLRYDESK